MYKRTITYTDYNGIERKEDFYFNFSKAELAEMELSTPGGMAAMMNRVIEARDDTSVLKIFKDLLLKSYGEKSADGKRFVKSEELSTAFSQTEAYSIMFMELATDSQAAANFVKAIIPQDIQNTLAEQSLAPLAS